MTTYQVIQTEYRTKTPTHPSQHDVICTEDEFFVDEASARAAFGEIELPPASREGDAYVFAEKELVRFEIADDEFSPTDVEESSMLAGTPTTVMLFRSEFTEKVFRNADSAPDCAVAAALASLNKRVGVDPCVEWIEGLEFKPYADNLRVENAPEDPQDAKRLVKAVWHGFTNYDLTFDTYSTIYKPEKGDPALYAFPQHMLAMIAERYPALKKTCEILAKYETEPPYDSSKQFINF